MGSLKKLISTVPLTLLLLCIGPSGAAGEGSSVTLPLEDYLRLVEDIERIGEERESPAEPTIAELTAHATAVTIDDLRTEGLMAEIEASYRVELRGRTLEPVALPMAGVVTSARIESSSGGGLGREAALHRKKGELLLVASKPGSYSVSVSARARLEDVSGISKLKLALSRAGVATLDVDLPSELRWKSVHAVAVEESMAEGRRRLRLAPIRGKRPVLELRRDATGTVEEQTRARAVVLTVARLGSGGVERHDVALYEVSRGELSRFELDLPAETSSAGIERAVTDEGPVLPLIEGGRLSVERRRHLGSAGYLALSYPPILPDATGRWPLPAIEPTVPVRSHYLVLASDRAGVIEPRPAAAWSRVDIDDLPRARRADIAAIGPSSVWRRTEVPAEPWLYLETYPAIDALPAIIGRRLTTTLLTVDGSLVHRDVFNLRRAGAALRLTLPTDATLWSVKVDGQAVRPIERASEIAVPLAFKAGDSISGGGTRVEVVTVLDQKVPRGSSRLKVELARLSEPVLEHQWRLLVPEQHRYRFAQGDLRPAPPHEAASADIGSLPTPLPRFSVVESIEGDGGIVGTVADEGGSWLPGVMITATAADGRTRSVVADGSGEFAFFGLGAGTYHVTASLDGYSSLSREVKVPAGRTVRCELTMPLAEVEETILVTASSPVVGPTASARAEFGAHQQQQSAQQELQEFQQGLVGGVKPLAVDIPESGKLLLLAGVLPPPDVRVELEMRVRR